MPLGLKTGWRWRMSKAPGLKAVAPFFLMSGFEHPVARDNLW